MQKFLLKKTVVVAVVNVGLWVKKRGQKRWLYPQLHIFFVLMTKFPIEATQSEGAFFPLNGREALAKKSFSVAGKIRESCWLKALAVEFFFKKRSNGKHFT